jgi:hypothetical protein
MMRPKWSAHSKSHSFRMQTRRASQLFRQIYKEGSSTFISSDKENIEKPDTVASTADSVRSTKTGSTRLSLKGNFARDCLERLRSRLEVHYLDDVQGELTVQEYV